MNDARGGPPSWTPAAVGAAPKHGTATDTELLDGAVWEHFVTALGNAGKSVGGAPPTDVSAGYRQLLVLLALGIDEALRHADPYDPHIKPGNVDNVLKWGMDCPDALYAGTPVRSS